MSNSNLLTDLEIKEKYSSASESFYHKLIKNLLKKNLPEFDKNIISIDDEKYLQDRRGDLCIEYRNGQKVIIEIQNSKMSVNEMKQRTLSLNSKGYYVLWVIYARGPITIELKLIENKKNVQVSPAELWLHKIYGGRVYYMDPILFNGKIKNYEPFAVHFSLSDKYNEKIRKKDFQHYFLRDSYSTKVSNWNLLCKEKNGFKIARFYDNNVMFILQGKIKSIISSFSEINKKKITKKLVKEILNQFYPKYGKKMIMKAILNLIKYEKIDLNLKICVKMKKKYGLR